MLRKVAFEILKSSAAVRPRPDQPGYMMHFDHAYDARQANGQTQRDLAAARGASRGVSPSMSERTLEGLLSLVEGAAALLSRRGRVVAMNSEAETITQAASYLTLGRDRRLVFREPIDDTAYVDALSQALPGQRIGMRAFFLAGAPCTTATLIPFPRPNPSHPADESIAGALIIIREVSHRGVPAHLLRTLFGLTAAESEIANAVALGMSAGHAAQALGISRTTARNQLSAAMTKMGVHRQAELVAKIAALTPRLRLTAG